MIKVTTIDRHAGSQALGEVCHRLVDTCSCGGSAQTVCKATFNSSIWVFGTFPAWHPRCDSPLGSNLKSLRPLILIIEPRTVRLRDARHVSWGAILLKDETLTACVTAVQWWSLQSSAVRITSKFVSSPQHQNQLISEPPTYWRKQHPKCSELVINFFQGSASTPSRWGGNINNFCVAYDLNILCAKYRRNRSLQLNEQWIVFLTHPVHSWLSHWPVCVSLVCSYHCTDVLTYSATQLQVCF